MACVLAPYMAHIHRAAPTNALMGCGKMGRVGANRKQGKWGGGRGVTGGGMHEKEGWAGKEKEKEKEKEIEKEKEEEKVCVMLAYAQWLHFSGIDLSAAGFYICICMRERERE